MVHIDPHATDLGTSATVAANIIAVIGGVSIGGRIIMGSGSDRIGSKSSCIIAFIMMASALLWLQIAKEVWMLYLFAAIFGFAYGGLAAIFPPLVAELFGLSSLGVIMGIIAFAGSIGGAIGPVLAGKMFDLSGSYGLVFLVCAAISTIGFISTAILTPTGREGGEK